MVAFLLATATAADCVRRPTDPELREEADAVWRSLEDGDEQRFVDALAQLSRAVPCLGEVPAPATLARVRLLEGVAAYGRGDADAAAGAFLAARSLDGELGLPVYPPDHEIWGVYRRLDPIRAERERLAPPRRGDLFVDGWEARDRYAAAPALVQVRDGGAVDTFVLGPGEAATYPVRHPVRTGLLATAAGLAAGSAGLLAASAGPRGAFNSGEATSVSELAALRSRTNALSAAGLGVGGAAGVFVGAAVVWWGR